MSISSCAVRRSRRTGQSGEQRLAHADKLRSAKDKASAAVVEELGTLASEIEKDAGAASGRDAARLKSLAETLKGRAGTLH